ncbi:MAG: DUF559 domain-containing protein [Rhodospirillales bacterium]
MASSRARKLRKNMTNAEKAFWSQVRDKRFHELRFRRQHPIGPYIVDFYCAAKEIVVELDGGQHTQETDLERSAFLQSCGLRVIRFWNNDVLSNLGGVLRSLENELDLE